MLDSAQLQALVDELLAKHDQPGVLAGVFSDGEIVTAAAGIANLNTGAPMTVDTGFLTGSITKVWHTCVAMTLVDDGLLDLDARVVDYAPEVQFGADPEIAQRVTIRQLLNHSSGVDAGDWAVDTGAYPEAVDRFVARLSEAGILHEPGRYPSYNNAGWCVLELVERRLTGKDFHTLLRERIIEPLGLRRTVTSVEEAILHATAVGHLPAPAGGFVATPRFLLPASLAPAGASLITTVDETLAFLAMHLDQGRGSDGTAVLSPAAVAAMQTPTITDPATAGGGFGLGWRYQDVVGTRLLAHGGGSIGGQASVVAVPSAKYAFVLYVNANTCSALLADLQQHLLAERLPAVERAMRTGTAEIDLDAFVGTYRQMTKSVSVSRDGDSRLRLQVDEVDVELEGANEYSAGLPTEFAATPVGPASVVVATEAGPVPAAFLEPDADGYFQLMSMGARIARRTS